MALHPSQRTADRSAHRCPANRLPVVGCCGHYYSRRHTDGPQFRRRYPHHNPQCHVPCVGVGRSQSASLLAPVFERRVYRHCHDRTRSRHDAEKPYLPQSARGAKGHVHLRHGLLASQCPVPWSRHTALHLVCPTEPHPSSRRRQPVALAHQQWCLGAVGHCALYHRHRSSRLFERRFGHDSAHHHYLHRPFRHERGQRATTCRITHPPYRTSVRSGRLCVVHHLVQGGG